MMERELNRISNVIWEMIKHIALLLEVEEEIYLDSKKITHHLKVHQSPYRMQLRNE
jgi:hypothetical protein